MRTNYLFCIILFAGFVLPSNSSFFIYLPGISLQIREAAFIILPIVNLFGNSSFSVKTESRKIKQLILIFLLVIIVTEVLKSLYFDSGITSVLRTFRIGLPLFSSLLIIYSGIRVNIHMVWRTLLWVISLSTVLSLLSLFIYLPIYPTFESVDYLAETAGRIRNANAPFGIIGIYLLYKDKDKWYNKGWLVKVASILSVIALILTFNRTYLPLLVLAIVYLTFSTFSFRHALKYLTIPLVIVTVAFWSYNTFDIVQSQVDRRILSILYGETNVLESVYIGDREVIFQGVMQRIKEGYWLFGLPINIPIFFWERWSGIYPMATTDTTIINVLLRYGLLPLLLFVRILLKTQRLNNNKIYLFALFFFFIASLNMDALMRHNSIFFLTILFFVSSVGSDKSHTG